MPPTAPAVCTAPKISEESLKTGESNLELTTRIMRFAQAPNLTGLPAISFPAGYDDEGLPIGFQVIARHWQEALLLQIAAVGEQSLSRKKPKIFYSFLGD